MANIHHSISELVGRTPLVEFDNYEKNWGWRLTYWENWNISIRREASKTARR